MVGLIIQKKTLSKDTNSFPFFPMCMQYTCIALSMIHFHLVHVVSLPYCLGKGLFCAFRQQLESSVLETTPAVVINQTPSHPSPGACDLFSMVTQSLHRTRLKSLFHPIWNPKLNDSMSQNLRTSSPPSAYHTPPYPYFYPLYLLPSTYSPNSYHIHHSSLHHSYPPKFITFTTSPALPI